MPDEQTRNTNDRSTQVEEIITELANCRIPPRLYRQVVALAGLAEKWLNQQERKCEWMKKHRNGEVWNHVEPRGTTSVHVEPRHVYKKEKIKKVSKILMPDTFSPNQEWAREDRGWDQAKSAEEAERFVGYCRAHGKKYVDWDHAWRNWCRSPYQKGANGNGQAFNRVRTLKERTADALQRLGSAELCEEIDLGVSQRRNGRPGILYRPSGNGAHQIRPSPTREGSESGRDTLGPPDFFAAGGSDQ